MKKIFVVFLLSLLPLFSQASPVCEAAFSDRVISTEVAPPIPPSKLKTAQNFILNSAGQVGLFLGGHEPAFPYRKNASFGRKVGDVTRMLYNNLVRMIFPLPFSKTPASLIFKKTYTDPSYVPTTEEVATLETYGQTKSFEKFSTFWRVHDKLRKTRKVLSVSAKALVLSTVLMTANTTAHFEQSPIMTSTEFVTRADQKLHDDEVQLLFEAPIAHLALRIGDHVYSYGVDTLSKTEAADYLGALHIEIAGKSSLQTSSDTISPKLDIGSALQNTISRSVQTITLKIGSDSVRKIRRDLEMSTLKHYENKTWINDCSTMMMRILRKDANAEIPQVFDSSPTMMMNWFVVASGTGFLAHEGIEIKSMATIADGGPAWHKAQLMKNFVANLAEATYFVNSLPAMAVQRIQFDATVDENHRQYWTKETQNILDQKAKDAVTQVDPSGALMELHLEYLSLKTLAATPERDAKLSRVVELGKLYVEQRKSELESLKDDELATLFDVISVTAQIPALATEFPEFGS